MTTKITKNAHKVLVALRKNHESNAHGWATVYIDNAMSDLTGMSRRSFAGYCSQLKKLGLYESYDHDREYKGIFGEVWMHDFIQPTRCFRGY